MLIAVRSWVDLHLEVVHGHKSAQEIAFAEELMKYLLRWDKTEAKLARSLQPADDLSLAVVSPLAGLLNRWFSIVGGGFGGNRVIAYVQQVPTVELRAELVTELTDIASQLMFKRKFVEPR